jgi:serine protease inhibitor
MSLSSYFSAVMFMKYCMPVPPPQFVANHPFVFVIKNIKVGIVLFAGRLSHV